MNINIIDANFLWIKLWLLRLLKVTKSKGTITLFFLVFEKKKELTKHQQVQHWPDWLSQQQDQDGEVLRPASQVYSCCRFQWHPCPLHLQLQPLHPPNHQGHLQKVIVGNKRSLKVSKGHWRYQKVIEGIKRSLKV